MRILDETTDKSIKNITLLLKTEEAIQFVGYLEELIANGSQTEHCHLNDADFSKEVTIALYNDDNIDGFSDRCKRLIIDDK